MRISYLLLTIAAGAMVGVSAARLSPWNDPVRIAFCLAGIVWFGLFAVYFAECAGGLLGGEEDEDEDEDEDEIITHPSLPDLTETTCMNCPYCDKPWRFFTAKIPDYYECSHCKLWFSSRDYIQSNRLENDTE